jgi:hypothetical protein
MDKDESPERGNMKFKILETTFGELKAGDVFCLGPSHPECGLKYLNIKIDGFGVYRGKDGKTIRPENEEQPFNVIGLGDGRPRSFCDKEKVYKVLNREKGQAAGRN